ncbi:MAG: DUF4432 family protein [Kiritimatiellae bacterium]|jgi:hypothetical protein|nr:DUF4432 family protein [Kiritimatiellia bacterium]HON48539.1 DUF4432 family protein [Kiritimatiellia bacterium]
MKIHLRNEFFSEVKRTLVESGEFKAETFRYSTGVDALKVSNSRGSFTILPFMGQMIWRCDFDGRELTMKSIYAEPKDCVTCFNESYGCFMMHCGLTAIGNPTAEDTHVGHAELPIIRYKEAYIEFGNDELGEYVAVGGTAYHDMCFTYNYAFSPRVVLRKGAAKLDIIVTAKNLKDLPLEYYYLCHINYRPVNGSKIVESPLAKKPIINHEVPADYHKPWADATNKWLAVLDKDYKAQSIVGAKGESYKPEIVNCYFHKPDKDGWAFVKQVYPKGGGVFVRYRPEELPYATRWIARTKDEDAMGMCLPATAEHKGRLCCRANNQQRTLAPGESVTFHVETGIL